MESAKDRLVKYLELAFDVPYGREKKAVVATLPKELSYHQDGEFKTIPRELLLTEAIETTGLVQTGVAATVAEGADQAKCWFNVLPVWRIKGNAYIHAVGEGGMYAAEVPEAAEVPNRTQDYTAATFAIKKYAQSPKISKEMIEDAMVDVIAQEILFAGKAVQNAAERICNNEILEASGTHHDTATTAGYMGVRGAVAARSLLLGLGFNASHVVLHPEAEPFVLNDLISPNPNPSFTGGQIGTYLGMEWLRCGVADVAGGTYTFGYGANDEIGMMVVDKDRAGGICVARPLTVDEYDDPVHDLRGMNVSMRMDCQSFVGTATATVGY